MLSRDGSLLLSLQLLNHLRIVSQIHLRANYEARHSGTVMPDFGEPLLLDVFKRCRGGDAETNQENVRLRVREWTQTIVIFLTYIDVTTIRKLALNGTISGWKHTGRVEQAQSVRVVSNHDRNSIVVEHLEWDTTGRFGITSLEKTW